MFKTLKLGEANLKRPEVWQSAPPPQVIYDNWETGVDLKKDSQGLDGIAHDYTPDPLDMIIGSYDIGDHILRDTVFLTYMDESWSAGHEILDHYIKEIALEPKNIESNQSINLTIGGMTLNSWGVSASDLDTTNAKIFLTIENQSLIENEA